MPELTRAALPFLPVLLLVALLLCLVPHLGVRGRTAVAVLFLGITFGFGIDILVLDHSEPHTLEVPNAFPRGPEGKLHTWTVDTVTAPSWHWHVTTMIAFGVPGVLLLLLARRSPKLPHPLLMPVLVFWFVLAFRLALEKTAAPLEIVWAIGATPSLLMTLPFLGYWCGRRGTTFPGFVGMLLVAALLQRLPILVWGYYATTRQLGTHLDTHLVTDMNFFGEKVFNDVFDAWLWPTAAPHLTVWILFTLVVGVVLGILPRWFGARRATAPAAEPV